MSAGIKLVEVELHTPKNVDSHMLLKLVMILVRKIGGKIIVTDADLVALPPVTELHSEVNPMTKDITLYIK